MAKPGNNSLIGIYSTQGRRKVHNYCTIQGPRTGQRAPSAAAGSKTDDPRRKNSMNMKQMKEAAKKMGYSVSVDKNDPKYKYTITNLNFPGNRPIETDRRGAELFLTDIDGYLDYCYEANIEPF